MLKVDYHPSLKEITNSLDTDLLNYTQRSSIPPCSVTKTVQTAIKRPKEKSVKKLVISVLNWTIVQHVPML